MKFKEYFLRTDHHIKQQAADLHEIKSELLAVTERHKNHENLLIEAENKAKNFELWYRELETPYL